MSEQVKPKEDEGKIAAFIVVKFRDNVKLPYKDGIGDYIQEMKIGPWDQLSREFPGISIHRLFRSLDPDEIMKLVGRARERDRTYEPPNFLTFFYIDAPPDTDLERLAKALNSWSSVKTAYIDRPAPDPAVNAADDPRWPNQGYLDPAPDGIDAEYAWGFGGGDGAGQTCIDLEKGWTLNHEDLVSLGANLLHGSIYADSRGHGTAVLGIICAVDNTLGCIGIAPNIGSINAVSYWGAGNNRPDAIIASLSHLSFGDVLLLEVQTVARVDFIPPDIVRNVYGPVEVLDADFEAIRLATALGIVVVEAGGNGTENGLAPAIDLDTYTNAAGQQILNRDPANPDFRDSGAIIVSASTSWAPHTRRAYATFGRRIDCYAWGHNIDTCSSDEFGATNQYRTNFGGTSGASAIIAGAALLVQGVAEDSLTYRFSPRQMRAILSDPANGTPPSPAEPTDMGVMPNLRAIIDDVIVLNASPDVYIRDNIGDTGDPHTGSISASPDIILLPAPVADPQTSFGEGSGTENSNTLGDEATAGQENYIYVRVRNRGGSPATNVVATVFWSEVSTLVTPPWNLVGSVTIPNVLTGDQLTVSNKIDWAAGDIPATGHYCFVGLIGNEQDPAPDPADFLNFDNFRRFIRENNNVTWRNFNVVGNQPNPEVGDPEDLVGLPFIARGAPEKARKMQLEVVGRLPKGARAFLEMPPYLVDVIQERSPFLKLEEKRRKVWLPVNPHGRRLLGEAMFPARAKIELRLLVHIPEDLRKNEYEIFVRQLYEKEEVGRVTWRLSPKVRRKKRRVKQEK
jgi:hypothetical protein